MEPSDTDELIDYPSMIDSAMRGVVREALNHAVRYGLPGEHHFFISFQTGFPGVQISETLRSRYPSEMTIVIQHQYWDLKVTEHHFEVTLSFGNVPEHLVIPFLAMTAFADPSIRFGLQFYGRDVMEQDEEKPQLRGKSKPRARQKRVEEADIAQAAAATANDDKVVSIDSFRKNKS